MTDYAKLYARLCGRSMRFWTSWERSRRRVMRGNGCKRQFWMRKRSIWTQKKRKSPRETPECVPRGHSFICYSVNSSACCASAPISARQALVIAAACSGQRPM